MGVCLKKNDYEENLGRCGGLWMGVSIMSACCAKKLIAPIQLTEHLLRFLVCFY